MDVPHGRTTWTYHMDVPHGRTTWTYHMAHSECPSSSQSNAWIAQRAKRAEKCHCPEKTTMALFWLTRQSCSEVLWVFIGQINSMKGNPDKKRVGKCTSRITYGKHVVNVYLCSTVGECAQYHTCHYTVRVQCRTLPRSIRSFRGRF